MKKYVVIFTDTFDFAQKTEVRELSEKDVRLIKKDIGNVVFSNWKLKSIEELKNIYVLVDSDGRITSETLQLIRSSLVNDLARSNFGKALKFGVEELKKAHAHVLSYGMVELYLIKKSNTNARNLKFKVPFINQDVHDLDGMQKILL